MMKLQRELIPSEQFTLLSMDRSSNEAIPKSCPSEFNNHFTLIIFLVQL